MSVNGDHVSALHGPLSLAADEPLQVNDLPRVMGRLQRLCRAARRDLSCCGVGISVMSASGELVNSAGSSGTCAWVEELQFSLGEGPSLAAFAARRPVLVPNLIEAATTMWPEYGPAAHSKGLRAVFAFPLQVGMAPLGALDVYQAEPGALSARAQDRALTYADLAAQMIFDAHGDTLETAAPDSH